MAKDKKLNEFDALFLEICRAIGIDKICNFIKKALNKMGYR